MKNIEDFLAKHYDIIHDDYLKTNSKWVKDTIILRDNRFNYNLHLQTLKLS